MVDFSAAHCMEAFFINPTMTLDNSIESLSPSPVTSEPAMSVKLDGHYPHTSHDGKKDANLSRPLTSMQDLMADSHFLAGYYSEEEAASSNDSTESLSIHSIHDGPDDSVPSQSSLVPEELAMSCDKIEHRVNRAQAVVLKAAGKPRVVSMPRLVETSTPGRFKRVMSGNDLAGKSKAQSHRRAFSLHTSHASSTQGSSRESTPPTDVDELPPALEPKHQKPSAPLPHGIAEFESFPNLSDLTVSPQSPPAHVEPRPALITSTSTASRVDPPGSSRSPTKRRFHKLASSSWLDHVGLASKRKPSISNLPARPSTPPPRPTLVLDTSFASKAPSVPIPQRLPSAKLVPRGANERAAPLVLPPFPDDADDDDFPDSHIEALPRFERPNLIRALTQRKPRPSISSRTSG